MGLSREGNMRLLPSNTQFSFPEVLAANDRDNSRGFTGDWYAAL